MTEAAIEQELQAKGLNAPRVFPHEIDALISEDRYHQPEGTTLTICILVLKNGFTVTGESAAASAENFDVEIGKKIAFTNARNKIWALAGYHLKQRLHETTLAVFDNPLGAVNTVAVMCHEANRIWCQMNGDFSQPAWADAPGWQRASARDGVHFHLGNPEAGPEASHENWMRQKEADGWTFGDEKDPDKKTHPCMVPFDELPAHQQIKDRIFQALVHAVGIPAGKF
ncbi:MAG: hypothetical protein EpisKO_41540 [Epibacterium sp.]